MVTYIIPDPYPLFFRVTLFDTPEDDEFDGDIGEHDSETPRALLNFRVEHYPGNQPTYSSASRTQSPLMVKGEDKERGARLNTTDASKSTAAN